ncbi:E3 ubiquitin-protein ligase DTX1 isoform X1 [Petromyzon marinus]|uniref:E3 ubiquitin-protein ligase DTX1 isoform X1 n=1 Tax=Petromyzon marinus TaxID=7757 RepID=UPI003F6E8E86
MMPLLGSEMQLLAAGAHPSALAGASPLALAPQPVWRVVVWEWLDDQQPSPLGAPTTQPTQQPPPQQPHNGQQQATTTTTHQQSQASTQQQQQQQQQLQQQPATVWRAYSAAVCHHIETVLRSGGLQGGGGGGMRGGSVGGGGGAGGASLGGSGSVVLGQADPTLSPYILDLQSMQQFRQDTGTMRPVRRSFYDPSAAPGRGVVWEWESESGVWTPYPMDVCVTIQNAHEKQHPWLDLATLGLPILLDFTAMCQIGRLGQTRRRLRRRLDTPYPLLVINSGGGSLAAGPLALPKSQSWPVGAGQASGGQGHHGGQHQQMHQQQIQQQQQQQMSLLCACPQCLHQQQQSHHHHHQNVQGHAQQQQQNMLGVTAYGTVTQRPALSTNNLASTATAGNATHHHHQQQQQQMQMQQAMSQQQQQRRRETFSSPTRQTQGQARSGLTVSRPRSQPALQAIAAGYTPANRGPGMPAIAMATSVSAPNNLNRPGVKQQRSVVGFTGSARPPGWVASRHACPPACLRMVPALPVKNLGGSGPINPALAGITGILMCAAGLPVFLTRAPKPVLHPPSVSKGELRAVPGVSGSCRKIKKKHARKGGRSPEEVVKKYLQKLKNPPDEDCTICMERLNVPSGYDGMCSHGSVKSEAVGRLGKCGHAFHALCMLAMYANGNKDGSLQCPTCKTIYGEKTGTQPPGKMEYHVIPYSLPGYSDCKTIRIIYDIPPGMQGPEHPNPGKKFTARGFPRHCYLPDNETGRKALRLLIVAWERRLIFTVGTSSTTGESDTVVWNEIHHKTEFGSNVTGHGFPDPNYLENVQAELAAQGVTEASLVD